MSTLMPQTAYGVPSRSSSGNLFEISVRSSPPTSICFLDLDCAALLDGAHVVAHQAFRDVAREQIGRGLADDVLRRHRDEPLERPVHEQIASVAVLRVDERVGRVVQDLLQAHLGIAQPQLGALQMRQIAHAQQHPPPAVDEHGLDVDQRVDGLALRVGEAPFEPLRQAGKRALHAARRGGLRPAPVGLARRRELEGIESDQRVARAPEQAARRLVAVLDGVGDHEDAEVRFREEEAVRVAVAGELAQPGRAGLGRHVRESRRRGRRRGPLLPGRNN